MSSNAVRIVSLVPSLTETLCFFGLQTHIVGCTNFCIEPKSLRKTVPAVGGTKDADLQKIIQLKPTHVVVNLEENTSALVHELRACAAIHNFTLVETFLEYPEDNFTLIKNFSTIFNFTDVAAEWINQQRRALDHLRERMVCKPNFKFAYFIWMNPWMTAGDKTYISRCLELIGGQNVVTTDTQPSNRYPCVQPTDVNLLSADWLLFSSEPFAFKNRHIQQYLDESGNHQQARKVDGQSLSWYGSRFEKTILELEVLRATLDKI